jgi:integrase
LRNQAGISKYRKRLEPSGACRVDDINSNGGKQAKILSDDQVERLRNPRRNRVLVLLSLKAGLRAGEIANLTWPMVLDPGGEIGSANPAFPICAMP